MSGELEFSSTPELLPEEEGGSVATDIVSSGNSGESAGSSEKEIRRTAAEAATSLQVEREFSLNGDGSGVSGEIRLEPPAPRNRRTAECEVLSVWSRVGVSGGVSEPGGEPPSSGCPPTVPGSKVSSTRVPCSLRTSPPFSRVVLYEPHSPHFIPRI